jgi:hypothetical protein
MRELLRRPQLSARERQWLFNIINRAVLVVAIPCDGTEYNPEIERVFAG